MAIRFDNVADQIYRTAGLINYNAAFTVMAWARMATLPVLGAWGTIFSLVNPTNDWTNRDELVFQEASGTVTLRCVCTVNKTETTFTGSTVLAKDTWYHVALVRSSTTLLTAYLNGGSEATDARNVSTRTAISRMEMGAHTTNLWDNLDGRAFVAMGWTRALSVAEILAQMNSIRPLDFTSLNFWTPMFPGTTERLTDYGGGGYNWTAAGTLTDEDPPPVSYGAYDSMDAVPIVTATGQPAILRTFGVPTGAGRRVRPGGWN